MTENPPERWRNEISGQVYYILAFTNTHDAIAAETATHHLGARLIPLPAQIAAGCGLALRFSPDILEKIHLPEDASARLFRAITKDDHREYKEVIRC